MSYARFRGGGLLHIVRRMPSLLETDGRLETECGIMAPIAWWHCYETEPSRYLECKRCWYGTEDDTIPEFKK